MKELTALGFAFNRAKLLKRNEQLRKDRIKYYENAERERAKLRQIMYASSEVKNATSTQI